MQYPVLSGGVLSWLWHLVMFGSIICKGFYDGLTDLEYTHSCLITTGEITGILEGQAVTAMTMQIILYFLEPRAYLAMIRREGFRVMNAADRVCISIVTAVLGP